MNTALALSATRLAPTPSPSVASHSGLVRRIALHLAGRLPSSVELDDLIQAGMLGLLDALKNFNADAGASFETYASIRIRGAMVDELRASDWAPRSVHKKIREAAEAMRQLEQRYGHAAREADVAAVLNLSINDYRQVLQDAAQCQMLSLDAPLEEDGNHQIADTEATAPLDHLQQKEFQLALAQVISRLPEKEQLVLSLYYREELNLREIGQVLSVSESRVCQIHGQALTRVRSQLGDWVQGSALGLLRKQKAVA